jgi:hypothetical protein
MKIECCGATSLEHPGGSCILKSEALRGLAKIQILDVNCCEATCWVAVYQSLTIKVQGLVGTQKILKKRPRGGCIVVADTNLVDGFMCLLHGSVSCIGSFEWFRCQLSDESFLD